MINIYSFIATGIDETDQDNHIPTDHQILSCYPNPFNSSVIISYNTYKKENVKSIEIYNILGEVIKILPIKNKQGKQIQIVWDATDLSGDKVSTGVYFVKAVTSHNSVASKLVYLK